MAENRFACLIRIKSAGNTRRHLITKQQFTIGRSEAADLPLLDLAVSRTHAKIEMRDESLYLTDISSNGTTINGDKALQNVAVKLESDSRVKFGSSAVEYFFIRVEAPMELRSPEEQKAILLQAMSDAEAEVEQAKINAAKEEREKGAAFIKQHEDSFRQREIQLDDHYRGKEKQLDELYRQKEDEARQRHEKTLHESHLKATQDLNASRLKADEIISQAQKAADAAGAKTLVEYEGKREKLRIEVDNMLAEGRTRLEQQEEMTVANIEKLKNDAKMQYDRELQLAKEKAEAVRVDADQKYNKRLDTADVEKKRILEKAAIDATAIAQDAENKAKIIIDEAKKRSANITLDSMKRAEREIEDEKRAAVDAMREATFAEQEKIVKEYRVRIEKLQAQQLELEAKVNDTETSVEGLMQDRTRLRSEVQSLEKYETEKRLALSQYDEQIAKAQKIIQSVESADAKREEAKREMIAAKQSAENFKADLDRQKKSIDDDLQHQKEQSVMEFTELKRKQEEVLATERLAAFDKLKQRIEEEEERYHRTLQMRSTEIASSISKHLVPKIESDLRAKGSDASLGSLLDLIRVAVDQVIVKEPSGVKAITEHLGADPVKAAEKKKKMKRWAAIGAAAAIAGLAIYAEPIYNFLKARNADHSEQREITLKRNAESIYTPVQNDDWHETYVGNVLYMRNYFEVKADPIYQEQWSLRLNNLEFLRSLHLSEDDMVQFIGKERALVMQLGDLRQSLDAKYLDEGLQKMNQAESAATTEMQKVLKSEENVAAVRKAEKDYVMQYIKVKFGNAGRTPSQESGADGSESAHSP